MDRTSVAITNNAQSDRYLVLISQVASISSSLPDFDSYHPSHHVSSGSHVLQCQTGTISTAPKRVSVCEHTVWRPRVGTGGTCLVPLGRYKLLLNSLYRHITRFSRTSSGG